MRKWLKSKTQTKGREKITKMRRGERDIVGKGDVDDDDNDDDDNDDHDNFHHIKL